MYYREREESKLN